MINTPKLKLILIAISTLTMFNPVEGMTKDAKDFKTFNDFLAYHAKDGTIVPLDREYIDVCPISYTLQPAVLRSARRVIVAEPNPARAKALAEYHWLHHGLTAEGSSSWSSEHGHYTFYSGEHDQAIWSGEKILKQGSELAHDGKLPVITQRVTDSARTMRHHFPPAKPIAIKDEALDYKGGSLGSNISKLTVITSGAALYTEQQQLFPHFAWETDYYVPRVRIMPVGDATQIDGVWIDTRKALAAEIAARDAAEIRFYKQQLARVVSLGLLAVSAACTDVLR